MSFFVIISKENLDLYDATPKVNRGILQKLLFFTNGSNDPMCSVAVFFNTHSRIVLLINLKQRIITSPRKPNSL
jgi:hypothetical protein